MSSTVVGLIRWLRAGQSGEVVSGCLFDRCGSLVRPPRTERQDSTPVCRGRLQLPFADVWAAPALNGPTFARSSRLA
jgi:hypothetical protein